MISIDRAVYRPNQAAEYLNVSRSFLYKLIRDGQLARLKLGGRATGLLREDLDAWLLKQRNAATV